VPLAKRRSATNYLYLDEFTKNTGRGRGCPQNRTGSISAPHSAVASEREDVRRAVPTVDALADAVAAEHALGALPQDVAPAAPVDAPVPGVGLAQGAFQAVPAAAALSPDAGPVMDALPAAAVAVAPPDAAAPEQQDALQDVPAVADAVPAAASHCSVPDALPGAVVPRAKAAVAPPDGSQHGSPAGLQFQAEQ